MLHKIMAVAGVAILGYFSANSFLKNEEVINKLERVKEIEYAKAKVNLESKYTNNGVIIDAKSAKNITMSNLIENNISMNDKNTLNKFQKAIKHAIIINNIENPSCADLVNTSLITNSECISIKDKINTFAEINSGVLTLNKNEISNIIENQNFFSKKSNESDGRYSFLSYDKNTMQTKLTKEKKEYEELNKLTRLVENTKDELELKNLAQKISDNARRNNSTASTINLFKIASINNRIEKLTGSGTVIDVKSYIEIQSDTESIDMDGFIKTSIEDKFNELTTNLTR